MDEFSQKLQEYDIAWVFSAISLEGNTTLFLDEIKKFMKAKKSLFLWSDNNPAII